MKLLCFSLLAGGVFATLPSVAQPASGGPTPSGPTSVPIDGGASLLLAGGVALSLKKLRQLKGRPRG